MSSDTERKDEFDLRFRLNMRLLADAFDRLHIPNDFHEAGDAQNLIGIRLFRRDRTVDASYVYLAKAEDLAELILLIPEKTPAEILK